MRDKILLEVRKRVMVGNRARVVDIKIVESFWLYADEHPSLTAYMRVNTSRFRTETIKVDLTFTRNKDRGAVMVEHARLLAATAVEGEFYGHRSRAW